MALAPYYFPYTIICKLLYRYNPRFFMVISEGIFDIFMQRLIEIWSNIPFLYAYYRLFYCSSYLRYACCIMILFGWLMTYMRTAAYKEKLEIILLLQEVLDVLTLELFSNIFFQIFLLL